MSITINHSNTNADVKLNALSLKTAEIAKKQQKEEGKMAVQLIQSAAVAPASGSSGSIVNTKA